MSLGPVLHVAGFGRPAPVQSGPVTPLSQAKRYRVKFIARFKKLSHRGPNRARSANISQRMRSRSTISSAVFLQEFAAVRFHLWEAIPERFEFLSSFPRCDAPLGTHFLVNDSAGPSMQVRNAAPSHSYIVMLHNLVTQHGNTLET